MHQVIAMLLLKKSKIYSKTKIKVMQIRITLHFYNYILYLSLCFLFIPQSWEKGAGAYPGYHRERCGVHPGQVASLSQCTVNSSVYKSTLESNVSPAAI